MLIEDERDALAYAVWMVGNMDTETDKNQWWRELDGVWKLASKRVDQMHDRGVVVGRGFEATGLKPLVDCETAPENKPEINLDPWYGWSWEYLRGFFVCAAVLHMCNVVFVSYVLEMRHLADTPFPEALPVAFVGGLLGLLLIGRDHRRALAKKKEAGETPTS